MFKILYHIIKNEDMGSIISLMQNLKYNHQL